MVFGPGVAEQGVNTKSIYSLNKYKQIPLEMQGFFR